jgi:hypothetical protein
MYASADVLLLNQIAAMEDAVIPCKLLTYMAAGCPIVAAVSEKGEGRSRDPPNKMPSARSGRRSGGPQHSNARVTKRS